MNKITKQDLIPVFDKLKNGRVMVVGDLAIDEMIYGSADRISREAPVLILKHKETKIILGGASNAAHNIAALGAQKVTVLGVRGDDFHGPLLVQAFENAGIDTSRIIVDPTRPTTTKTRIFCCFSSICYTANSLDLIEKIIVLFLMILKALLLNKCTKRLKNMMLFFCLITVLVLLLQK